MTLYSILEGMLPPDTKGIETVSVEVSADRLVDITMTVGRLDQHEMVLSYDTTDIRLQATLEEYQTLPPDWMQTIKPRPSLKLKELYNLPQD